MATAKFTEISPKIGRSSDDIKNALQILGIPYNDDEILVSPSEIDTVGTVLKTLSDIAKKSKKPFAQAVQEYVEKTARDRQAAQGETQDSGEDTLENNVFKQLYDRYYESRGLKDAPKGSAAEHIQRQSHDTGVGLGLQTYAASLQMAQLTSSALMQYGGESYQEYIEGIAKKGGDYEGAIDEMGKLLGQQTQQQQTTAAFRAIEGTNWSQDPFAILDSLEAERKALPTSATTPTSTPLSSAKRLNSAPPEKK